MKVKFLKIFLVFFLVFGSTFAFTQSDTDTYEEEDQALEEYPWSYRKELGFNFTPLISKLIPFNFGDADAGFTYFHFKKYGRKYAFRFNAGLDFSSFDFEEGFLSLAIGYERRRYITPKVTLTNGVDFGIFGRFEDDAPALFTGLVYGIEYNFNDDVFIGTEANIQLLFNEIIFFDVNPPAAIYLFVRL